MNWQQKKIVASINHQNVIYELLNNQNYISRKEKQITLEDGSNYTEFVSCSYLGLDQNIRIINSVSNNINQSGFTFSSSRSRMKYNGLEILESLINNIFKMNTVLFSTTHLVHLGMIPLIASGEMPFVKIASGGCCFLLDKEVHASIQINRGLMEQFGNVKLIDFHDIQLVEDNLKLIENNQTPILFSDSIGSMKGVVDIKGLLELSYKYDGYLYLDDAHGMSVYGKNGSGYVMQVLDNVLPDRLILTTSFAKGFGTSGGAIILNNKKSIQFIKQFCSTYMFSGSLINPLINGSIESAKIHLSAEVSLLQKQLYSNIMLFDSLILEKNNIINFDLNTPIRGVFIGNEEDAIKCGLYFRQRGIFVSVVTYPIRQIGQAIIRILICANHTRNDIIKICELINNLKIHFQN